MVGDKRLWTLLVAIVAALALSGMLVGKVGARSNVAIRAPQDASTGHTVKVNGHGEVMAAPDEATVTLGVNAHGASAAEALSKAASRMQSVISAVESEGIPPDHIQTSDLSLYYDNNSGDYIASHEITVTIDDIRKTGQVLDTAVAAGADSSWGVSFGLKDPSAEQAQALAAAVADARKHANTMATALGVNITGVGVAQEVSYGQPPIVYAQAGARAASTAPTPIQPGQLTVTADVTVAFTFG